MADKRRTLEVVVAGDSSGGEQALKKFGDSADTAAGKSESSGKRIAGAFGAVFDQLKNIDVLGPLSEVTDHLGSAFDMLAEKGKSVGGVLIGLGGAGIGIGGAIAALGEEDRVAQAQLRATIEATGSAYEDYVSKIETAINRQEHFGYTADETDKALRLLTQAMNDPQKALDTLQLATDLAAAKNIGLADAATLLAKAYGGSAKVFKQFGIDTAGVTSAVKEQSKAQDELTKAQDKQQKTVETLALLEERLAGKKTLTIAEQQHLAKATADADDANAHFAETQAAFTKAQADAAAGTDKMSKAFDELQAKLSGQAEAKADSWPGKLRAIKAEIQDTAASIGQDYGPAFMTFGAVMTTAGAITQTAQGVVQLFSRSTKAATVATEGLTVATEAQTVAEGVALGPILLIIAAVAALALGAFLLYENWDAVWSGVQTISSGVFDWFSSNWPLLLGIITGPFGLAALAVYTYWDDIVGFITGLPGRITDAASGMWDGIVGAFRSAINIIIDGWNGLQFDIPGFSIGPVSFGGFTLGVPDIPHLAAGGVVTRPTLALLGEAGPEAVVPLGSGHLGGNTYIFQNHGVIGSQNELQQWLYAALESGARRGVLPGDKTRKAFAG